MGVEGSYTFGKFIAVTVVLLALLQSTLTWFGAPLSVRLLAAVFALLLSKFYTAPFYLDGVGSIQISFDTGRICSVHNVLVLDGRVSAAKIHAAFADFYLNDPKFDLFKHNVVPRRFLWPYYSYDQTFDESNHFFTHSERIDHAGLQLWLSEQLSTGFDVNHPLWAVHVFENYEDGDTAMIFKYHHCYADGYHMGHMMLLACEPVGASLSTPSAKKPKPTSKASRPNPVLTGLSAAAKLLLLPQDPAGIFKPAKHMHSGSPRHAVWHQSRFSVEQLKAAGKAADSSINDVIMAALTGAVRRFAVQDRASDLQGCALPQGCMWVSLKPPSRMFLPEAEEPVSWGNSTLGAAYMQLPIEVPDPKERLVETQSRINALIGSPEPLIANWAMRLFGTLPSFISRPLWAATAFKTSISVSNLPGPQYQGYKFLGNSLKELSFFVPPVGSLGIFITLFSCSGRLTCSMSADASIISSEEAQRVVGEYLEEELALLVG